MFQRLLVPLDGSSLAEQALSVAAHLARASHGSIVLVRAINSAMTRAAREANLAHAQEYLDQISTVPPLHDISVETIAHTGPAVSTILATVHSRAIDLIVISSHGNRATARAGMGPTAQEVTHLANVPVLLLRAEAPLLVGVHSDAHRPLRILVGLDGSAHAKQALLPAATLIAALAAPAQGIVHLTRVITSSTYERAGQYHQRPEDAIQKAKESLVKTVENIHDGFEAPSIAALGLQLTWSVAIGSDVSETLIRVAEYGSGQPETDREGNKITLSANEKTLQLDMGTLTHQSSVDHYPEYGEGVEGSGESPCCDIIALSTHGQSSLPRWAMGRVIEQVLTGTKLPMLIVCLERIGNEEQFKPATQTAPTS